jgi:hypothetical protein
VGFILCEELRGENVVGSSNHGFKDNGVFIQMMVGIGMEVSICMGLLLIKLVGKRTIKKERDNNIQEGNGIVLLGLHSKLDPRGKDVKMVKEGGQVGMAMRPKKKCDIYKLKPTFGFEMKVV